MTEPVTDPQSPKDEGEEYAKDEIWCLQRLGKDYDWLHLFENSEVTIGRGLNVTHQILSASCPLMISRNHCMLKQKDDGQWTVTDNGSLNGVWVNGTRISSGKEHLLKLGNLIRFGVPLDGSPVEFEYTLVRRPFDDLKSFLSKRTRTEGSSAALFPKTKKIKRKFSADETGPCTSSDPKSKLYRSSTTDKLQALPCPIASRPLEEAGPSDRSVSSSSSSNRTRDLATLKMYNMNLVVLKDQMGDLQKRAAELESQEQGYELEKLEVREQLELLNSKLRRQHEQGLQHMQSLESSFCDEERRLEVEKAKQNEEGLKKQLEEALQEHRKVIAELKHSFEEMLQAKDKELEVTKEVKEKVSAQKEEVVSQMTEVLENELQCIICAELLIEAVTLNCAHSFCRHCIEEWRQRKNECPICRQAISSQTRSLVLDNCIDRMVESLSPDMKQRRQQLISERKGERQGGSAIPECGGDP